MNSYVKKKCLPTKYKNSPKKEIYKQLITILLQTDIYNSHKPETQNYSILLLLHFFPMRPQSAQQSKTVLFNQLSGHYYTLSDAGKQVKVNKRGDLATKFTNGFTGFLNFKERKNLSMKDQALMYTQPKVSYDKENAFLCPAGTKFYGYAQSPYNLKGKTPQFLGGDTFKQTFEAKNASKSIKTQENAPSHNHTHSSNQEKKLNKLQSAKLFRKEISSQLNFELLKDKCSDNRSTEEWRTRFKQRHNTTVERFDKSIILDARQNYLATTHKRIKSTNVSSVPSLHKESSAKKSLHHQSYFEQSLSNIQRTQTPNFMTCKLNYDEFASTFNQTSVKAKCYKTSCHFTQYMPKRRYQKLERENNTVTIGEYKIELEAEKKEKELVDRLREQLKVYQPVVEVEVKKEEEKKTDKDKGKKGVQNGKK